MRRSAGDFTQLGRRRLAIQHLCACHLCLLQWWLLLLLLLLLGARCALLLVILLRILDPPGKAGSQATMAQVGESRKVMLPSHITFHLSFSPPPPPSHSIEQSFPPHPPREGGEELPEVPPSPPNPPF